MTAYRFDNWSRLVGAWVEVHQNGRFVRAGFVDAAMPDSTMLWLAPDGVHSRKLIDAALGHEVRIEPRQLRSPVAP